MLSQEKLFQSHFFSPLENKKCVPVQRPSAGKERAQTESPLAGSITPEKEIE